MKIALLLAVLLAPGAVMAQSEVCNSSWTVNTNFGSGEYVETRNTTSPYVSLTFTQNLKLYCITTATNVTETVC